MQYRVYCIYSCVTIATSMECDQYMLIYFKRIQKKIKYGLFYTHSKKKKKKELYNIHNNNLHILLQQRSEKNYKKPHVLQSLDLKWMMKRKIEFKILHWKNRFFFRPNSI